MSGPRKDTIERLVEEMLGGITEDKTVTVDELFSAAVTVVLRLIKVTLLIDPTAGPCIEAAGIYPLIAACNPVTKLRRPTDS